MVKGHDQRHVPTQGGKAIIADDIVGGIQSGSLDGQAEDFSPPIERREPEGTVMTIAISHSDDQG
ncbi:hypothetical protein KFU94_08515 [Chloroflexi bacterium TSY]|nr:hypothetical protein [Chloroflexi bacterium TSY]